MVLYFALILTTLIYAFSCFAGPWVHVISSSWSSSLLSTGKPEGSTRAIEIGTPRDNKEAFAPQSQGLEERHRLSVWPNSDTPGKQVQDKKTWAWWQGLRALLLRHRLAGCMIWVSPSLWAPLLSPVECTPSLGGVWVHCEGPWVV